MKHLILPDAHDRPGTNQDRFEWIGNLAVQRRPDVIIDIGDFADMESLCSYDKGKKEYEGRRYIKDVASARKARERLMAPIHTHNAKYPDDQYTPKLKALVGNHEARITKATSLQPELDGFLNIDDLGAVEMGWDVVPFLQPIMINGIAYCHYFTSGVMGRPIGGKSPAGMLLEKKHISCIQGHDHLLDFSCATRADGKKIMAMTVGCYFDYDMHWAGPANSIYWRGVVMLNDVKDGSFDPEAININRMKKEYS